MQTHFIKLVSIVLVGGTGYGRVDGIEVFATGLLCVCVYICVTTFVQICDFFCTQHLQFAHSLADECK